MIITEVSPGESPSFSYTYLNQYPDPFVSEKKKLSDEGYIKNTLDYFAYIAYSQYNRNKETFAKNYNLMNGILTPEDFYQDEPVRDFIDTLKENMELPAHVKHYPIVNSPVNTMMGELAKRPDIHRVRAFDDMSQNEELEYKTEIMQQLILQQAASIIRNKAAISGQELDDEQLQTLTFEKAKESLLDFTSNGEVWGNNTLTALKAEFNLKEKSESGFRDLNVVAREFFEVYENNSKTGFNVRTHNPKNVVYRGSVDTKFTSGASGEDDVPYFIGTIYVKEISQIISEITDLTKEEVDHLKEKSQESILLSGKKSNLYRDVEGQQSIQYQTYSRLLEQERLFMEAELQQEWRDIIPFTMGDNNQFFDYKYVVVTVYWCSKKKIGKLTYLDEEGNPQVILVDETYKTSPNEIDIEWGWVNQWYQGIKIGPDVYKIKPFTLLNYAPIIGLIYEAKNTQPKSLVDMMKPYQILYNICMTQLYELLEKEIGNVGWISLRRIPRSKNGDDNDAIDEWEMNAKEKGIIFDDNSPENTKVPGDNTSVARNIDLTRSAEIQSRYNLAVALKQECWELIGMNRQRLGSPLATETATANQNALVQSFAQTEPIFAAHSYVLNQLYQAILDAAQQIESKKPFSTLSYINNSGTGTFIQIAGSDLTLRDFKVFVVSRAEDQQMFNEFRQLAQAMIQNGTSIYDISLLYSTNSIREMQNAFKRLKELQEQYAAQAQQSEQAQIEQEGQIERAKLEQEDRHHYEELASAEYIAQLKANTDLAKAEISTYFQAPTTDANNNGTPDIMDIANHQLKIQQSLEAARRDNKKLNLEQQKFMAEQSNKKKEFELAEEKIKVDREKIKASKQKKPTKK